MTPDIDKGLEQIRGRHGAQSLARVEAMLSATHKQRDPLQYQAKWIMPGLTSRPWHDPYEWDSIRPIARRLEDIHPHIRAEFAQFRSGQAKGLENYAHYKGVQRDWKALYLFRAGRPVLESRAAVPRTFQFMQEELGDALCPLLEMHFSVLLPGARIPPHCDLWNFTICLHLAVDIPRDCVLRVANEERTWQEGRCLLFDYSYLHEAWNKSDRIRTCLLLDLWSPEVTLAEREALVLIVTEVRRALGESQDAS